MAFLLALSSASRRALIVCAVLLTSFMSACTVHAGMVNPFYLRSRASHLAVKFITAPIPLKLAQS